MLSIFYNNINIPERSTVTNNFQAESNQEIGYGNKLNIELEVKRKNILSEI
jgi:hypothetical protein